MTATTLSRRRVRRVGCEKSRNGCQTCKIRRVKCDETKPHCRKCTDSGRKCEGPAAGRHIRFAEDHPRRLCYSDASAAAVAAAAALVLSPEVSQLVPQHTHDERWAFNYFLHRAAPVFAGNIDAPFWLDLVPRLAQTHEFVWDTLMSISWSFEHVPYQMLEPSFHPCRANSVVGSEHSRSLRWYNKAVSRFRHSLARGELDASYALLSCMLFATFEFQQRNNGNALLLMDTAARILADTYASPASQQMTPASVAICEVVAAFFSRKAVLMAIVASHLLPPPEHSRAATPADSPVDVSPASWSTTSSASSSTPPTPFTEARESLNRLMYDCYEVIRVAVLLSHDRDEMKKLQSEQQRHLNKMDQWRTWFGQLYNANAAAITPTTDDELVSSSLWMYWGVCRIMLASCLSGKETTFDEHMSEFAQILDHAQHVVQSISEHTGHQSEFPFEADLAPLLYFVATKCRDPVMRRRALRLMRRIPRRTMLWASVAADSVVQKIISTEEGRSVHSTPEQPFLLPPEEHRVHHIAIVKREHVGDSTRLQVQLSKPVIETTGIYRMAHEVVWLNDGIDVPG